MLRELVRRAVGTAERHGHGELPARHGEHVRRVVDDLVERHQRERERHELDDGPQPGHRRPHAQARESGLGDGRVDHALGAEPFQQALADLVSAVVLGYLLAHEERVRVALHFFEEGFVDGLAVGNFAHGKEKGQWLAATPFTVLTNV